MVVVGKVPPHTHTHTLHTLAHDLSRPRPLRSYPFETEVGVMGAALASWAAAAAAFALAPHRSLARLAGRAALTLAVILYPTTLQHAATLVHCEAVALAASALRSLDGGGSLLESSRGSSSGAAAPLVPTPLLASNPFFVCWAPGGSHRPAGVLAGIVLPLYWQRCRSLCSRG